MKYTILVIYLLCATIHSFAQNCSIKNLVFEGGGIRGVAYAGVIDELEKHNMLAQVEKVGDTSAGAITALMLSLGYTSKEIADIIATTNFGKFNDGQYLFIGGIIRMNKLYGWYRGESFSKWLSQLIENKTGNAEITFEELSARGFKDLYLTATCLNKQSLVVFSKESYPTMKVKDAVRASMSIPLYYTAVFIDSTGKTYKKADKSKQLDIMVDGGIIGNFPISIFDTLAIDSLGKKTRIINKATIGIRLDTDTQIQNDATSRELVPMEIQNLNDYLSSIYIIVIENLNRNQLTDEDWQRTISISSVDIHPKVKRLSKEQKERLIKSGQKYTSNYLKHNCDL